MQKEDNSPLPWAEPGPLTEEERFLFSVAGFLLIPGAISDEETAACLKAAKRIYKPSDQKQWRQIGHAHETEAAFENLMDHPSVFPKVRALLGDKFYLQSSWCTKVPAGFPGQPLHQDGSAAYPFRRLGRPTPLVQLRIGFVLTALPEPDMGNLVIIPGSHNSSEILPHGATPNDIPIAQTICAEPGTAILFHQGVYHCGGRNTMDYNRYMIHMVYAPPWLAASDREQNDPVFLARTTPMRRALAGEWSRPDEPFGSGLEPLPFED